MASDDANSGCSGHLQERYTLVSPERGVRRDAPSSKMVVVQKLESGRAQLTRGRVRHPFTRSPTIRGPGKGEHPGRKGPGTVLSGPIHTKNGRLPPQHDRAVDAIGQTPKLHTPLPHTQPTSENG